jgi:hypothetical protein
MISASDINSIYKNWCDIWVKSNVNSKINAYKAPDK